MKDQVIQFIEKNVDGCGSDAVIAISIRRNEQITEEHREKLLQELISIKKEWKDVLWDTDELIFEALSRVFGDDACISTVFPAIVVEF